MRPGGVVGGNVLCQAILSLKPSRMAIVSAEDQEMCIVRPNIVVCVSFNGEASKE